MYAAYLPIDGINVTKELFVDLCHTGAIDRQTAATIWDDCVYDLYVRRINHARAVSLIRSTLRSALGAYQMCVLWDEMRSKPTA